MGFPTDLFFYNDDRYILIMCLSSETGNVYGYFHPQYKEEEAVDHYNQIKKSFEENGIKDKILYLSECKKISNPGIKIKAASLSDGYLLSIMSNVINADYDLKDKNKKSY